MLTALVRSVVSGIVATCFALSATTLGAMPLACASVVSAEPSPAHHHGSEPGHSHRGRLPAGAHCPIHLCCATLATPVVPSLSIHASIAAQQSIGFVPFSSVPSSHPPHFLPFANAPPLASS
jgi:hypothetical protein